MPYGLRYFAPMESLFDHPLLKGAIASILAALSTLLHHKPQWAVLVCLLVFIDLVTGVMAAAKRGEKITSYGFRQTAIKAVEYTLFLVAATAIANSFSLLTWLGESVYIYVALTELTSIAENLSGTKGMAEIWAKIKGQIDKRLPG
jgi:phage-related holin